MRSIVQVVSQLVQALHYAMAFFIHEEVKAKGINRHLNRRVYVYCLSGGRSGRTFAYLKQIGYTNVKNIGGISAYSGKVVK